MMSQLIHRLLTQVVRELFRELSRKRPPESITGKAWVVDGDTIKVTGETVRIGGLDAPELGQRSLSQDGHWFDHGQYVRSVLIRKIGGRHVCVRSREYDAYGRVVGTVTCGDTDIGGWLVGSGLAVAAYDRRYEQLEGEARRHKRGIWGVAQAYDPTAWRLGERAQLEAD